MWNNILTRSESWTCVSTETGGDVALFPTMVQINSVHAYQLTEHNHLAEYPVRLPFKKGKNKSDLFLSIGLMIKCLEKYIWQERHALTEQNANYGQCERTTTFARQKISLYLRRTGLKCFGGHSEILGWCWLPKTLHMQTPIISQLGHESKVTTWGV